MNRRLLLIFSLLIGCLLPGASQPKSQDDAKAALAEVDAQIAHEQERGDIGKEGEARWQKIVTLKNFSMTQEQAVEAGIQMDWFRKHKQWDNFYRSWQLRANAYCALGKLQLGLQETQRMLDDAKDRNNKMGRAMAYKQIGVIYLNMKQTEPAVEALQHYADLMKDEDDDFSSLSNIYYRMAKAYDYDHAFGEELKITNQWLKFLQDKVKDINSPEAREGYNAYYLARASAFIGLNRLDEARRALNEASRHAHQVKTALSLHHYYKMAACYHLASGEAAEALLYTDSVRMTTQEKDDHTAEVRAQALMMLGQDAEAARIYQRLYHEKDSVFGRDARQHLDELNTMFQIDELKTEQQQAKFKYILIAASSIVVALLLLLYFGWRSAIKQKRVNEELRIANERAKVSSKMKAEFIRNITHEIRTPLNIVSGLTQILNEPDMDLGQSEKNDLLERVRENTDRITNLVDRMLELSDVSSEILIERHDEATVQDIVSQAIEFSGIVGQTYPGNAESAVKFDFIDNQEVASITLHTNKVYAIRALSQLLENAAKFTHEGGITLRMENTDKSVRLIVEDTGVGIPSVESEHIFEEFVQLDEFADGTGIGLTVAHSIAQRMGGDLWLDTDYSQGARFVLELLKA